MIKGIAHVAFTVSRMEESLHFYCDVLGFTKAFELQDDKGNPWIVYIKVCEDQFVELFYGSTEENPRQSYSHLCLEVEDIHQIASRLKECGVVLDSEPRQGKDTNWQCWAKDPDGNRIEFMQMNPASPQKQYRNNG